MPERVRVGRTYRYFNANPHGPSCPYNFEVEKRKALIQLVEDLEPYVHMTVGYNEQLNSYMIKASITILDERNDYKEADNESYCRNDA